MSAAQQFKPESFLPECAAHYLIQTDLGEGHRTTYALIKVNSYDTPKHYRTGIRVARLYPPEHNLTAGCTTALKKEVRQHP